MARIQNTLTDHIVVAGYGISGSEAVRELIARGTEPSRIVVIDCDAEALERPKSWAARCCRRRDPRHDAAGGADRRRAAR